MSEAETSKILVNPFPGPQPYRASDRDRFYGREEVAHELSSTILAHRCVTLFGPSGAGKSSVMQAAVLPVLDEDYDFRHVSIEGWPLNEAPVRWLLESLTTQLRLPPPDVELGLVELVDLTVKQAFRRSDRPILIYLDQIEQLLLPSRADSDVTAILDWLDRLAESPRRGLHLVLAMREDYLGRFRDRARGRHWLLENGFRLGPMTVGEIIGAICLAASHGTPSQKWSPNSMRSLMLQVRTPGQSETDSAEVQTAFAQIVCRALFVERAERGETSGAVAPVEAEPILYRYLESTLESLGPLREPAERLMEDHLVAADGSRSILTEEAARASGVLSDEQLDTVLRILEAAAILRAEQHRGTRYFEIGHDWLAKKVHDRRLDREERARVLARQRELEAERLQAEEKLKRAQEETRRARIIVLVVLTLLLASIFLGIYAWTQQQAARAETKRALAAEKAATEARNQAERATEVAKAAESKAVVALSAEQAAKDKADKAAAVALEQKKIAEEQRAAAVQSEERAQEALRGQRRATKEAQRQKGKAEQNLERAEDEARRARDANRLAVALSILEKDPTSALALLLEVEDPASTRGWTPATVEALQRPASKAVIRGHEGYAVAVDMSPDGARVATASHDGSGLLSPTFGQDEALRLAGHKGKVVDIAFSPDGKHVVTASTDGTARLWSLDGKPATGLKGHTGPVVDVAFSPDSKRAVTASNDGTARVWEVANPSQPIAVLKGHTGPVRSVDFHPKGTRVLTASDDGTARVWSLQKPDEPVVLEGHQGTVYSAKFSSNGKHVVTAGDDRTSRVFQVASVDPGSELKDAIVLRGHKDAVYSAEFSNDGRRIVTTSRDRTARLWTVPSTQGKNPKDNVSVPLRGHRDKVYLGRFSPNGKYVATVSRDGTARLWAADGAGDIRILRGHTRPVVGLDFSDDSTLLATVAEDGTARVWDVEDHNSELILEGHKKTVRGAGVSESRHIVTASADKTARLWSLKNGRLRLMTTLRGHEKEVIYAGISPNGKVAFTGSLDGTARIWRISKTASKTSANPVKTIQLEQAGRPTFVTFSPDGDKLLTSSTDTVWVIDTKTGKRTALRGHRGEVRHASFSRDGKRVVTAANDRTVRLWSTDGAGKPVVLRGHEGSVYYASFSPDGARVATASWDGTARVWNASTGSVVVILAGHKKAVNSVEFSHDGTRVVTTSDDGTARIWSTDGQGDTVTLYGHEAPVVHAIFGPNDRTVITSSSDKTARVWEADFQNPELLRSRIRQTSSVCLTIEQRVVLLGESPSNANERHAECEQRKP